VYALPIDPPASDVVVTLNGGALTVMLKLAVVVACVGVCESVAVTLKLVVPVKVPLGVPEIAPVAEFKVNPAGRLPVVTAQV
jgi:hypothetical protein